MARSAEVAVILAGCGHADGAETREAVFALLALDQHGARFQCLAPNAAQAEVVDHATGQAAGGGRNILEESSRIARVGQCLDLAQADPGRYDALILPGGSGVAKNLCTFAKDGARASGTNDKAGNFLNLIRWTSPRTIKECFAAHREFDYPFMEEA